MAKMMMDDTEHIGKRKLESRSELHKIGFSACLRLFYLLEYLYCCTYLDCFYFYVTMMTSNSHQRCNNQRTLHPFDTHTPIVYCLSQENK